MEPMSGIERFSDERYSRKLSKIEISAKKVGMETVMRRVGLKEAIGYDTISLDPLVDWPCFSPHPGRDWLRDVTNKLIDDGIFFVTSGHPYGLVRVTADDIAKMSRGEVKKASRVLQNRSDHLGRVVAHVQSDASLLSLNVARTVFSLASAACGEQSVIKVEKVVSAHTSGEFDIRGMLKQLGL